MSLPWQPISGEVFDALKFDGISSAVDFSTQAYPMGPTTVELMIKPDEIGRKQALASQGGAVIDLVLEQDGTVSAQRLNEERGTDIAHGKTRLTAGQWACITGTCDLGHLRIYVNGKLDGETLSSGLRSTEGVRLGGPFWGTEGFFKGLVARYRVLDGNSRPEQIALNAAALAKVCAQLRETPEKH